MWLKSVVRTVKDIFFRYLRRKFIITVEPLAASTEQQRRVSIIMAREPTQNDLLTELGNLDEQLVIVHDQHAQILKYLEDLTVRRAKIVLALQEKKNG